MLSFDHVALGVGAAHAVVGALVGDLGGTVIGGGTPPRSGFRAVQIHLGEPHDLGMTVEVLEPHAPHHNDFLERFVNSRGDGPHHVTFKTNDIWAEHDRLRELGITPVGVQFDNERWREMFVHPRDAHGIVVQIAQSGSRHPPMPERLRRSRERMPSMDQRPWWRDAISQRADDAVRARRLVMSSPDPAAARTFWVEVLYGVQTEAGIEWDGGTLSVEEGDATGVSRIDVHGLHDATQIGGAQFVPIAERR